MEPSPLLRCRWSWDVMEGIWEAGGTCRWSWTRLIPAGIVGWADAVLCPHLDFRSLQVFHFSFPFFFPPTFKAGVYFTRSELLIKQTQATDAIISRTS